MRLGREDRGRPIGETIGTPAGRVDRYGIALVLIVATIVAIFTMPESRWGPVLANLIVAATLVFILAASEARPRLVLAARVFAVGAVGISVVGALVGDSAVSEAISSLAGATLAIVAPVPIVRRLVAQPVISSHTVLGAISLYLLFGVFFAYMFAAVGAFSGQFFVQSSTSRMPDFLYFSFVTQGTIGYGDLTARTDVGRLLAVAEGIAGQLYLVTVVAVVVGNVGRARTRHEGGPDALAPGVTGRTAGGDRGAEEVPATERPVGPR